MRNNEIPFNSKMRKDDLIEQIKKFIIDKDKSQDVDKCEEYEDKSNNDMDDSNNNNDSTSNFGAGINADQQEEFKHNQVISKSLHVVCLAQGGAS